MGTRIGYSRDTGLWVIKDAKDKVTDKVGGFKLKVDGKVILESSIEPTPEASKANYGDYNAMMDIPDDVEVELIQERHQVKWKNSVCPICNRRPKSG